MLPLRGARRWGTTAPMVLPHPRHDEDSDDLRGDRADVLRVDDVEFSCVIGIYDEERTRPQPLRVTLALPLNAATSAATGDLRCSVDYARLLGQVGFVLEHGAFRLIETAGEALCAVVLGSVAGVADGVALTLRKPRALAGNGVPSLSLRRRRRQPARLVSAAGVLDTLWAGPDVALFRWAVAPGVRFLRAGDVAVFDVDAGRRGVDVHDSVVTGGRTLLMAAPTTTTAAQLLAAAG
jgi:dihydroneopterin aldolase